MAVSVLTPEGAETLNRFITTVWPAIMHAGRREKILSTLSLIMGSRGLGEAGPDVVTEAIKLVVSKAYDPFFHMMEDMEGFKRRTLDTCENMDAYRARPIAVRRWERTGVGQTGKPADQMKVLAFCASPRRKGNTSL